jgi:peptidoglycan/LPS O-acetylase OafA/YrhL
MRPANVPRLSGYEPAFDGLRALAVTSVVAFHAFPALLPGAWIGVEFFFVLSGYLITSLLSREMALSGTIAFKKFFMRRILRLTPAFWAMLTCAAAVAIVSATRPADLRAVLISGVYLMNWNRAFNLFPQGLLGHTWSLAMEEQFYLLWPAALLFITPRRPVRWVALAIVAITVWRSYLAFSGADPERTYNGFDTHGDTLLIGCVLALLPITAKAAARAATLTVIPIAGTILMIATAYHRTVFMQTIGYTLIALLSGWLIIGASQPSRWRQVLSSKPLVFTGRISYGWYLWHYPILLFGEQTPFLQTAWGRVALVLIAYPVAAVSYRYIEQPFLHLKSRFEPNEIKHFAQPKDEASVQLNAQASS